MALTTPLIDKVALITGASGGIGRTIATALGSVGVRLVLTSRTGARLERTVGLLESGGLDRERMVAINADLLVPEAGEALVRAALERFGRLDVVIHAAGIGRFAHYETQSLDEITECVGVNMLGAMYLAHHAAAPLIQSQGHVIHVASGLSRKPHGRAAIYAAANHGLRGFTESLRLDLGRHGVKVSLVTAAGGGVDTEFWSLADPAVKREGMLAPERVAEAVLVVLTARGGALIDELDVRTR